MTLAEENYLKAIFHIEQESGQGASTSSISKHLDTRAASVSDMLRKLSDKKLISYEKYYGASLTEKGRLAAIMTIRRHRLWETFLVEKLHFGWDEVHEVAEDLEHIKSDQLINALEAHLDFPKVDPHGDPIPDAHGNWKQIDKKTLSDCEESERGIIVGVKDSSADFLQLLDKRNIAIGSKFEVDFVERFDGSIQVKINHRSLLLTQKLAENIYVSIG
jgi:DtxR family Mn-dependent transcriptional regulator